MSGGRFLVNLNEVINSESIIKMKSLFPHELEISALTTESNQEYDEGILQEHILMLQSLNYDHLVLSEKSLQVVAYISGYFPHRSLIDASCSDCVNLLRQDPILTEYLQNLDRGGPTPPSSTPNHYVASAFCVLKLVKLKLSKLQFLGKL